MCEQVWLIKSYMKQIIPPSVFETDWSLIVMIWYLQEDHEQPSKSQRKNPPFVRHHRKISSLWCLMFISHDELWNFDFYNVLKPSCLRSKRSVSASSSTTLTTWTCSQSKVVDWKQTRQLYDCCSCCMSGDAFPSGVFRTLFTILHFLPWVFFLYESWCTMTSKKLPFKETAHNP